MGKKKQKKNKKKEEIPESLKELWYQQMKEREEILGESYNFSDWCKEQSGVDV